MLIARAKALRWMLLVYMSWTSFFGICLWSVGMIYSALSIGIPEIRIYWKGSDSRLGFVSSVGMAMFFWCPMAVGAAVNLGIIVPTFLSCDKPLAVTILKINYPCHSIKVLKFEIRIQSCV
jgi:hypothetical protein